MSKRRWGAPTWILLHTFVAKVKPDKYDSVKHSLLDWIKRLASVLPCPDCAYHATTHLGTVNAGRLATKEKFIEMMWIFHNKVNARVGKPVQPRKVLDIYNKVNLQYIYKVFATEYTRPLHNVRLVSQDMARRDIVTRLTRWLRTNQISFYF
jgi:hypothetical protein